MFLALCRMIARIVSSLSSVRLVSLSSVGIARLVVADMRPMPVEGVVSSMTLSLCAMPPCSVRVVVVERPCGADLILESDFFWPIVPQCFWE